MRYHPLLLSLLALVSACSPPPAASCVPGQTIECPCTAGGRGSQTCGSEGRFSTCECLAIDASVDVPALPDVSGPDEGAEASPQLDASDAAAADSSVDAPPASDAAAEVGTPPLPSCVSPRGMACITTGCDFAPASLRSCEPSGAELPFYGAEYCTHAATVLVLTAGWCAPCSAEASAIEQQIQQVYGPRGVRVMHVVLQKPDFSAADADFCTSWQRRYSLTGTMALDPRGEIARYAPMMALPAHLVVDREGVIRFSETGTSAGLSPLRMAIDAVLMRP